MTASAAQPVRTAADALKAEWTKLRTVSATAWLLAATIGLTVAVGFATAASVHFNAKGTYQDPTKLALTGIDLGQATVAALAVLAISSEYSTGMIRVTLAAMPRRSSMLAAKAVLLSGLVLIAGTVAVLISLLFGHLLLPGNGFTPAHGYTAISLGYGPTLRAAAGSVLYLVLITLLGLGVATAVRDSAAAIGVILALLYLFPIIAQVTGNTDWRQHLQQIGPMTAGLAIQATTHLQNLPISPWAGLGVLAAWTAASLLLATLLLRLRDA